MVLSTPRPKADLTARARELQSNLGGRATVGILHDMLLVDVDRANLVEVAREIRDSPMTQCDLYSVNAGVDTGTEMSSITFVRGTKTGVFVMLRTGCTETDPHIPSLEGIWVGANWCERETYDMYGIIFDGHPDLRRIFLEESFPGHPLRKAFLPPRSDARGG